MSLEELLNEGATFKTVWMIRVTMLTRFKQDTEWFIYKHPVFYSGAVSAQNSLTLNSCVSVCLCVCRN